MTNERTYSCLFVFLNCFFIIFSYRIQITVGKSILLTICLLLALLIIEPLSNKHIINKSIYSDRKAIKPYIIQYSMSLILIIQLSFNDKHFKTTLSIYLAQLFFVSSTIIILYLFKIKLNSFNWNINLKQVMIIVFIFILIKVVPILGNHNELVLAYNKIFNLNGLLKLIRLIFYPAFYEEIVHRGLLISALKGYKLEEFKINIIQSILFGILHFSNYKAYGWIGFFMVSVQIMLGYILGKLYFKTKSLTPCILLHALINIF